MVREGRRTDEKDNLGNCIIYVVIKFIGQKVLDTG